MIRRFVCLSLLLALVALTPASMAGAEDEKLAMVSLAARNADTSQAPLGDGSAEFVPPCESLPTDRAFIDVATGFDGWFPVDFCTAGSTGAGPAVAPECHHNDDDSAVFTLPFTFDLYGDAFTDVFINNNGNLSFGALFSTFTASGFPIADFPMVAPFWGDVDTGNPDNTVGEVWQKEIDGSTFSVTWDNVGYFSEHGDLRNTFQVMISDGTNPDMGIGNNVCFCWDDMQWTTGDASSGVGGFGGTPATVGANKGDGVEFFQIGRFDKPGDDYDGPNGETDGVDWLDNRGICFNASDATNVPPIPVDFPPSDTFDLLCDETLDHTLSFLSPEAGQTTTVVINDVNDAQGAGLVITNTPGNTATVDLDWTPDAGDIGTYVLVFTATDDFTPPGETVKTLVINVDCELAIFLESFSADVESGGVRLKWSTSAEIDNVGFRVLRAAEVKQAGGFQEDSEVILHGEPIVVEPYIPSQGDQLTGADYEYLDAGRQRPGTVYYYLEDIDNLGRTTRHGPVRVEIPRFMGLIRASSQR
jgi:hypothetical protein